MVSRTLRVVAMLSALILLGRRSLIFGMPSSLELVTILSIFPEIK